jgi:CRP-like cAMP-binding protein
VFKVFVAVNLILAALPELVYQRLTSQLEEVKLSQGEVIYRAKETIEYVYFPTETAISLVSMMENGSTTEICLIGREGTIGLPLVLGDNISPHLAIAQISGNALKINARAIAQEFARGEELQRLLLLYTKARLTAIGQIAACNRQHFIEARLARWLLSVSDRIDRSDFMVTQEVIANMLGVRRSGINAAASMLQQAEIISYSRGQINILNRSALETTACECYQLIKNELSRLFN